MPSSVPRTSSPVLALPPGYRLVSLRESGDAFAHACRIGWESGAGTLVSVGRFDVLEFAVVLEPEEPLASARRGFFAGMVALADALASFAPPERPITFTWPGTVHFNDARIGVVEACNGLSMLMIFFAIAVGLTLVIQRSWIDKAVLVASAVPIALIANIIRITVTGILHETVGGEVADMVFHTLAGWLMMPLALGILWGELGLLARLLLEGPDKRHSGREQMRVVLARSKAPLRSAKVRA